MLQTAIGRRLISLYRHLFRRFGPQHWWPARSRFEVMVGAILTQNTAWTNVEKAITALRTARLLNPPGIDTASQETLSRLIRSSGYYNMKAKRLKQFTRFLLTRYSGSVRRMFRTETAGLREELLDVTGIGEETADSILLYAGDRPIFVVDAYTRRVLERHELIAANTSYGEIQRLFMTHLSADPALFNEYHALLVAVGKTYCRKTPQCDSCPLRYDLPEGSPLLPSPE
ncbi:endonuclease III domain-containing protein [Candidatus Methylomirabilis sp.]|uniref:Endonuclease III domain-containing protein n=1 Tax=Candidatus Methylomirabilis tolerans TaxID=3123416 RepID=A0AAJ1AFV9_9BACT|nr:endonuclease III domain-containing protein [Candidatus Methylomirabilis sp.]